MSHSFANEARRYIIVVRCLSGFPLSLSSFVAYQAFRNRNRCLLPLGSSLLCAFGLSYASRARRCCMPLGSLFAAYRARRYCVPLGS